LNAVSNATSLPANAPVCEDAASAPAELEPDSDIPGSTDSKKRIRVGIDGFPIVMFWNDGEETKFYGKMNFNNDKGNDRTFGFKSGDEC
jgi:hypothetical protein